MAQINANEILIFGGEDRKTLKDSKLVFIAKVSTEFSQITV
jgi:hypothetical protein